LSSTTTIEEAVHAALARVDDPEIHKPITELGMVKSVAVSADGVAAVGVYLTVAGCPMRDTITSRVTAAVSAVPGISRVEVELDVMSDEQRTALRRGLRGDAAEPVIPFAQPGSLTRVYCVASGKGGVGKSSVTVNLAAALAAKGMSVGVVDADIYGHSIPRMLGTTTLPTKVDDMIMPPQAHGVKVISIGMFTPGNDAVVWRGPMLHRALQQFLADVFWGDLDVLLLDLPPGTGDIAISTAQLLPTPSCWSSPPRSWPRPRSPSGPGRSRCRPSSASPASSRTCRGWSCPTAPAWRSSAPAAGRPWPTRCRARSARPCRCSARSRWSRGCASAATPAPRSCWRRPDRRAGRPSGRWPTSSPSAPAVWPG
jgi:metal-sulfur cluster biosynthetic enzyme